MTQTFTNGGETYFAVATFDAPATGELRDHHRHRGRRACIIAPSFSAFGRSRSPGSRPSGSAALLALIGLILLIVGLVRRSSSKKAVAPAAGAYGATAYQQSVAQPTAYQQPVPAQPAVPQPVAPPVADGPVVPVAPEPVAPQPVAPPVAPQPGRPGEPAGRLVPRPGSSRRPALLGRRSLDRAHGLTRRRVITTV